MVAKSLGWLGGLAGAAKAKKHLTAKNAKKGREVREEWHMILCDLCVNLAIFAVESSSNLACCCRFRDMSLRSIDDRKCGR
jgi:hypothetical protein